MSAKTILKMLLRVTVCLAGVTNLFHSADTHAQRCCRISLISYISHRKGTCSQIWVSPTPVSQHCGSCLCGVLLEIHRKWLLRLAIQLKCYFWGWQGCVLAGLLCAHNCCSRTVHFGGVSCEEQRGSPVRVFAVSASLCGQSTGREGLPGSGASLPIPVTICLFAEK